MKLPFILLLDGMMGAGKTTASVGLAKEIPRLATIGADKIKWFISDFERCEEDNQIAREIVFAMVKVYLENGISVLIDQPIREHKDDLKIYEDLAKAYDVPIIKVQLHLDPEVSFKRVMARQKDRERKVPEDRIKRNIALFKNREEQGFLVIDTTNITPGEVLNKILNLLEK